MIKSSVTLLATALSLPVAATALAGEHYPASNCEIFVDRVGLSTSSHGSITAHFFVKTLNDRLDSPIAEVGVRTQVTTRTMRDTFVGDWGDLRAVSFFGAPDYFQITQNLSSEYSSNRMQSAFYVRTTKGTTYWVKPNNPHNYNNGGNFGYDGELAPTVRAILGRDYIFRGAFEDSVETRGNAMGAFNESGCR